jgi:hypothetical protein
VTGDTTFGDNTVNWEEPAGTPMLVKLPPRIQR